MQRNREATQDITNPTPPLPTHGAHWHEFGKTQPG